MESKYKRAYILTYNGLLLMGWVMVLVSIGDSLLSTGKIGALSEDTKLYLDLYQAAEFLDVVHAALGLVRSSPGQAFIQWAGRCNVLFGVLRMTTPEVASAPVVTVMVVVWALADVIRYAWNMTKTLQLELRPLTWLRYTAFIVLYPVGVLAEMKIVYDSLPHILRLKPYSIEMPGGYPLGYAEALWVLLYVYPFGFWKLYSSLLKQRKQRLGSTEAKAKAA